MKSEEIDEQAFLRIRKRLTGEFIRSFNSVDKIAHMFIINIMRDVNIFDYANEYEKGKIAGIKENIMVAGSEPVPNHRRDKHQQTQEN